MKRCTAAPPDGVGRGDITSLWIVLAKGVKPLGAPDSINGAMLGATDSINGAIMAASGRLVAGGPRDPGLSQSLEPLQWLLCVPGWRVPDVEFAFAPLINRLSLNYREYRYIGISNNNGILTTRYYLEVKRHPQTRRPRA